MGLLSLTCRLGLRICCIMLGMKAAHVSPAQATPICLKTEELWNQVDMVRWQM